LTQVNCARGSLDKLEPINGIVVHMNACFHCGLPVLEPGRYRADLLGAARELCCAGCEAVARTIAAAGLEAYYETRSSAAAPPADLPPLEELDTAPGGTEAALIVDRVRCTACLWLVEQTLRRTAGVTRAHVNYATQRAQVAWDPATTSLSALVRAVRGVGYDAYPYEPRREDELLRRESRQALMRLFVAGFGAMQVMMYAFPAYVDEGLSAEAAAMMRWAGLFITTPVLLFSCAPFFSGARLELRQRRIGLDTPIALGLAAAYCASTWATLTGTGQVYFDSIGMLAFLLLGARHLEAAARRRAARALDPLLRWLPARTLKAGEIVHVAPGERLPADGVVTGGISSVDESLLTGESRPVRKGRGDELIAGSINLEQPLAMRVTRAGADTRAASIARLVERATASRPRLVDAAERVARYLAPAVVAAAGLAWAWSRDPWIAVAVLVVTCPCALALAAPVVLTRASAALLARGVLLTRARALGVFERASEVIFDKTGTLTQGDLALARAVPLARLSDAEALELAASLEARSRHPAARAFAGLPLRAASDLIHVPAEGIEGRISGRRMRIGTARFCAALHGKPLPGELAPLEAGHTRIYLCDADGWLAAFDLEDRLRPEAAALVEDLRARGIFVHLVSGDDPQVVAALARRLGIPAFAGGVTPEGKLDYLRRRQGGGRRVVMIGDGLNDAPVLAQADASIAMGGGAAAAQHHADVVVMRNSLADVRGVFETARRAMRLVRQDLAWALAYNAAALPLAAAGAIGPLEAALVMGASSLVVLLNSQRRLTEPLPWKASISLSPSPSPSYS
jgi:P-type Cu2+ transporter